MWQRVRDSNPRKRSQSPVCYRYTNPLNCMSHRARVYYIQVNGKVKHYFPFPRKYFSRGTDSYASGFSSQGKGFPFSTCRRK